MSPSRRRRQQAVYVPMWYANFIGLAGLAFVIYLCANQGVGSALFCLFVVVFVFVGLLIHVKH
ncbi:hypothetical protein GA0070609_4058 [Micromonospora echinaurantiaca]|uniref:Uncharacterized protein n=1 Tax=Micromonospora echinaurantiaca TaxID=47857 RepID=A0A1C5J4T5_9ACTN|nr:hypothetical protein GA0070609_4058 [Micromonospora echinaurantiaca]